MKIADMTIEGLTPLDVERIKNTLDAEAEAQYRRLTQTVILIEKFKPQINALRRSGFPWNVIAKTLETTTGKSISASSIRNYMERHQRPSRKKLLTKNPKSDGELNTDKPNAHASAASDWSDSEQTADSDGNRPGRPI
jgi:hypothetical protein